MSGVAQMTGHEIGIAGYGVWLPRRRMERKVIAGAHRWFNPALMAAARGTRSHCSWDEDSITMAVAAARGALDGREREAVDSIALASTTPPFLDRQNATVIAEACGLAGTGLRTLDVTGSLRAGTGALLAALQDGAIARGGPAHGNQALVAAADCRRAKPGSPDELAFGHGAAAFLLGGAEPIAVLRGWRSVSDDFVDHYRAAGSPFDYRWEERWARDEGSARLLPDAVAGLLAELSLSPADIDHLVLPAASARDAQRLAKACGLDPDRARDPLDQSCGQLGAAQAPLLLAHCLEQAAPGQRILVAGLGQGCDLLLFETAEALAGYRSAAPASAALDAGWSDENYFRFLAFEGTLELDSGIRAEADLKTAHSVAYRHHEALTGLQAGRCTACGTVQFPPERVCVNRNCGAVDSQEPYPLAGRTARVVSLTADRLAYHPDPPSRYGLVEFEEGGRLLVEFVEWDRAELKVGAAASLAFRIKDRDAHRGFRRYFWKAVPA